MRELVQITFLALSILAGSPAFAAGTPSASARMTIRVENGSWGAAQPRDIEVVLASVADVLTPYFPRRARERVSVTFSPDGPRVLFAKSSDGAHRVLLNVQDTRWDQFAYQFSHELCHIFTNYEHRAIGTGPVAADHQWFEEALCEAVSLFVLNRMSSSWEQSPPHASWRAYAPAFREYAQRLLDNPRRYLPPGQSFDEWFQRRYDALERNPYSREENAIVATKLLAMLERTPGSLEAVGYLNSDQGLPPRSFGAYLASWFACCPDGRRDFISQIIALLGENREKQPRNS